MTAASGDRDEVPGSWLSHLMATLRLGIPLAGVHLAQIAITTADMIMIGWLGAAQLAAGVLATQVYFLLLMFGSGFSHAMVPLVAQAHGRGSVAAVRRAVRMGIWVALAYSALAMIPLWWLEPLLMLLGQEPEVAALAGSYMRIMQWTLFLSTLMLVMRSFLVSIEHAQIMLWSTIVAAVANVIFNYMLIFGHWGAPALGLRGAAHASVLATALGFLIVLVYALLRRDVARFSAFSHLWRIETATLGEIVRLGWPIGLTIVAEAGLFAAASMMMGWLGTVQLAAHGIAVQLAAIAFMLPLGLSGVATVRVGHAIGRGDRPDVERAALTVLGCAVATGTVSALFFWLVPRPLAGLFLDYGNPDAADVLAVASMLLAVAAAFQLFDSLQTVTMGLLRGLKDTRRPMILAIVSYWLLGVPCASLLGFVAGMGGRGIWLGLAIGLAAAASMLLLRFRKLLARQPQVVR